ncbi:AAA family ATPase [Vibrio sp. TH_r3]|uniref:ExeA family protein n=1 Tax=Vibrio sp. TH_r3 TaxID=3082084 RepID=UPI002954C018|nr:AAA family ATPase [Vibrio sp. TH_r3]MDV7104546.1 AAA family ATPase [Vibrio sp. TH_r3]
MYKDFFGFIEAPFSIVPSSRYLFLSRRHREAMGHLQAGLGDGGGFAMLTGEVGTGKTTVSKALLASFDENVKAGLILTPTFSEQDFLEAICDEFAIEYSQPSSFKQLTQGIHRYLLDNHAKGYQSLLLIDEAQHLSAQVLEQLRLLTNLETDTHKLLKVLLIGQPELQTKLQTSELRQLAQRITGRYHLLPLSEEEISQYIEFRLRIAGGQQSLFHNKALKVIAQYSHGVPRLINLICDKALLYAFYSGEKQISVHQAETACQDVMSFQAPVTFVRHESSRTTADTIKSTITTNVPINGTTTANIPSNNRANNKAVFPFRVSAMVLSIILFGLALNFEGRIKEVIRSYYPPITIVDQSTLVDQSSPNHVYDIDHEIKSFVENSYNPMDAMVALYRLWGIKASILDAECKDNMPFFCERRNGDLQSIIAQDRPVVLTLQSPNGPFFAVLYGVYQDKIELINSEQRLSLPIKWLENHWSGEYQTLWYSEIDQVLKIDSNGKSVERLDALLAKALQTDKTDSSIFSTQLENRVKAFQAWQGLTSDGIVGRNTLKLLDLITTDFAPKLLSVHEAAN